MLPFYRAPRAVTFIQRQPRGGDAVLSPSTRATALCWALASLLAALPPRADAHMGDKVYLIHRVEPGDLDLHDGTLADWHEVGLAPAVVGEDFVCFPDVGDGAPMGLPDLGVTVYLAWQAEPGRLFVAVDRVDDVLLSEFDMSRPLDGSWGWTMWGHDSIELMVDADHTGGMYYREYEFGQIENLDYYIYRTAQHYTVINVGQAGASIAYAPYTGLPSWLGEPSLTAAGGFTTSTEPFRAVLEVMMTPFDEVLRREPAEASTPSALWLGKIIGLEVSVPDFDTVPGEYHSFHNLGGGHAAWRNADEFVDFRLVGSASTSVGDVTWGRIKASFGR